MAIGAILALLGGAGAVGSQFLNQGDDVDPGGLPAAGINPFSNLLGGALTQDALFQLGDPRFLQATQLGNVFTEINQAALTGQLSKSQAKGATRVSQELQKFVEAQLAAGADPDQLNAEVERFLLTDAKKASLGIDIPNEINQLGVSGRLSKQDAKAARKVSDALDLVGQEALARGQDPIAAVEAALSVTPDKKGNIIVGGAKFSAEDLPIFQNALALTGRSLEDLQSFGIRDISAKDRKAFGQALGVLGRTPSDIVASSFAQRQQANALNEIFTGSFGEDVGADLQTRVDQLSQINEQRAAAQTRAGDLAEMLQTPEGFVELLRSFEPSELPEGLRDLALLERGEEFLPTAGELPSLAGVEAPQQDLPEFDLQQFGIEGVDPTRDFLPGLDLQQADFQQTPVDVFSAEDVEALAAQREEILRAELDREVQARQQDILTQANAAGINPAGQLAELERERLRQIDAIGFQARQEATELLQTQTGFQSQGVQSAALQAETEQGLQGELLNQMIAQVAAQSGLEAQDIQDAIAFAVSSGQLQASDLQNALALASSGSAIGTQNLNNILALATNEQNLLAGRLGLAQGTQGFEQTNLGLAGLSQDLDLQALQLQALPEQLAQQQLIREAEGTAGILDPATQAGIASLGPSVQLQTSAGSVAANQQANFANAAIANAQLDADARSQQNQAVGQVGGALFGLGVQGGQIGGREFRGIGG
jgi:hypothetical protein